MLSINPRPVSYPRRQQFHRLRHAAAAAIGCAAAVVLALVAARAGAMSMALLLSVVALGFGFSARRWRRLAERGRVGARSEGDVRRRARLARA
jgi:hypothetical protein